MSVGNTLSRVFFYLCDCHLSIKSNSLTYLLTSKEKNISTTVPL